VMSHPSFRRASSELPLNRMQNDPSLSFQKRNLRCGQTIPRKPLFINRLAVHFSVSPCTLMTVWNLCFGGVLNQLVKHYVRAARQGTGRSKEKPL